jgi:hypothetical protein
MSRSMRHVILPACAFVIFLAIASTPVEVLGCRNRGMMAFGVSLASGVGALAAAVIGLRTRIRGSSNSIWWVITCLILTLPVVALLLLA